MPRLDWSDDNVVKSPPNCFNDKQIQDLEPEKALEVYTQFEEFAKEQIYPRWVESCITKKENKANMTF